MAFPSFDWAWRNGQKIKPRILVLEVKDKERMEAPAIGWVVVEREETYERDPGNGEVCEASIRLSYQTITARRSSYDYGKGQFCGSYSRFFNAVSLTSSSMAKGAVFLDLPELRGQRVGTYLMNEIVQWVQQWPEADVNAIELLRGQAKGDNKARRNRFYEQFGLRFDYSDSGQREGVSRPMQVKSLTVVNGWEKNISEHRMFDYLGERLDAFDHVQLELGARDQVNTYLREELKKAESRPLRWALKRLYIEYSGLMSLGVILAFFAALFWIKNG
ncbi:hypothetical protein J1G18_07410 [Pseudomonas sp. MIS38]|uniref:hypothetical protein n=1 Tax=Pseudomonas sp. MIS38 TaxID=91465 RepID=UPI001CA72316|nr:hypothetical protein [Pseudomonas sp. MIS38]MBY8957109.1 hypothetical protein [Pseudomonas sp. MIS38]